MHLKFRYHTILSDSQFSIIIVISCIYSPEQKVKSKARDKQLSDEVTCRDPRFKFICDKVIKQNITLSNTDAFPFVLIEEYVSE